MARDDDNDRIRRRREREEEEDIEMRANRAKRLGIDAPTEVVGDSVTEKLNDIMRRIEPQIERVNGLYNQYFAGVERTPPLEARKQLDLLMVTLEMMPKPLLANYQFRCRGLQSVFNAHRDRWDRLMKDYESGKKKRPAAPKDRAPRGF